MKILAYSNSVCTEVRHALPFDKFHDSECQNEIFRMAKKMVKERQDITGLNCIKGESGKVIVDDLAFGFSFYDIFMPSSIL